MFSLFYCKGVEQIYWSEIIDEKITQDCVESWALKWPWTPVFSIFCNNSPKISQEQKNIHDVSQMISQRIVFVVFLDAIPEVGLCMILYKHQILYFRQIRHLIQISLSQIKK